MGETIEGWVRGEPLDEGGCAPEDAELGALLRATSPPDGLSDDEAARVLRGVVDRLRTSAAGQPRTRAWPRPLAWAAAALGVLVAVTVGSWLVRSHSPRQPQAVVAPDRAIAKEVVYEGRHDGKVVRIHMIVYEES